MPPAVGENSAMSVPRSRCSLSWFFSIVSTTWSSLISSLREIGALASFCSWRHALSSAGAVV
jgi:hypothetical protein